MEHTPLSFIPAPSSPLDIALDRLIDRALQEMAEEAQQLDPEPWDGLSPDDGGGL